jgi:2-hydroxy-3-keto-5-methylthiopentenyl-1-phosphate phosphatase
MYKNILDIVIRPRISKNVNFIKEKNVAVPIVRCGKFFLLLCYLNTKI